MPSFRWRRCDLPSTDHATLTTTDVAAWLEFPDARLKPLRQQYECLPGLHYGYRCPDLPFESVLQVNEAGFVTSYPPLWEPEP